MGERISNYDKRSRQRRDSVKHLTARWCFGSDNFIEYHNKYFDHYNNTPILPG
jgi:hypothetical protein